MKKRKIIYEKWKAFAKKLSEVIAHVMEFPVTWRHGGATKVNTFKDAKEMGIKLIRLGWKMKKTRRFK